MERETTTTGYDLYEVANDQWALHVKGGAAFVGTFRKVITHAVTHLNFKIEEIEFATKEMIKQEHNAAHFGMYRGFLFTFKKDFVHVKRQAG